MVIAGARSREISARTDRCTAAESPPAKASKRGASSPFGAAPSPASTPVRYALCVYGTADKQERVCIHTPTPVQHGDAWKMVYRGVSAPVRLTQPRRDVPESDEFHCRTHIPVTITVCDSPGQHSLRHTL
jgi:hypothetical protein